MTAGSRAAVLIGAGVLALVGAGSGNPYHLSLGFVVLLNVVLASSWNLISGFTGYTSFGHVAFYGVGAYVAALLLSGPAWPWPVAFLAGGAAAALLAAVVGWPCLRLKGPYFAIAMLGLAETLRVVALAWESVTAGGSGLPVPPVLSPRGLYLVMAGLALTAVATLLVVAGSPFGRRLLAIREDEIGAEMMGVDATAYKLAAFVLSALLAGVAGGVDAARIGFIEPTSTFAVAITIEMIVMTMLGGRGTALGPALGAVLLTLVREALSARYPYYYQMLFGLLVVALVLFAPDGILGAAKARARAARLRAAGAGS